MNLNYKPDHCFPNVSVHAVTWGASEILLRPIPRLRLMRMRYDQGLGFLKDLQAILMCRQVWEPLKWRF